MYIIVHLKATVMAKKVNFTTKKIPGVAKAAGTPRPDGGEKLTQSTEDLGTEDREWAKKLEIKQAAARKKTRDALKGNTPPATG